LAEGLFSFDAVIFDSDVHFRVGGQVGEHGLASC